MWGTVMLTIRSYIVTVAFLFLLLAAFALAGCNTVEGMGRDIESAGQAIQDTF